MFFLSANMAKAADLRQAFSPGFLGKSANQAGYDLNTKPQNIIAIIIQTALMFLGVIFLILMIYGGYLWMTARGNEEQVTKAKNLISAAIIGLVIVLAAYAISYFIISRLGINTLREIEGPALP